MTNSHDFFKKLSTLLEGKAEKPDFLDIDKDGDKKELMKSAAKENKKDVKESDAALFRKYSTIVAEWENTTKEDVDSEEELEEEDKLDEIGTLGAMAVGHAISGQQIDQSKLAAHRNFQKAGHYAQYQGTTPKIPTSLPAQSSSARDMMQKARGMSNR